MLSWVLHAWISYLKELVGQCDSLFDKIATSTVWEILRSKDKTRPYLQSLSTAKSTAAPAAPKDCPREYGDNRDMFINVAAANGFTECVHILLDPVGTPIDVLGGNDMTTLMHACYQGHTDLAQMLLDRGADPLLDEERDNCLHLTCRGGHLVIAKLLLRKTVDLNRCGEHGRTQLMYASYYGHEDIVKLVLEKGAHTSVDSGSVTNKDSCLHLACMVGETNIVKILLDHGMNIEGVSDKYRRTPLMYACRHGKLETAKELKRRHAVLDIVHENNFSCLHLAAMKGHVPTAEWLLQSGITVNCVNSASRTPLMYAFQNRHIDMVTFLMNNDADMQMVDDRRTTCLHFAAKSGDLQLVQLCLGFDHSIDSLTQEGWTPIMLACDQGHICIVEELEKKGADINLGGGCLYVACNKGWYNIVKFLTSVGGDEPSYINKRGPKNATPLMIACYRGYTAIVDHLLSCGADVLCKNDYGRTCLHAASNGDHQVVAEKLVGFFNVDELGASDHELIELIGRFSHMSADN